MSRQEDINYNAELQRDRALVEKEKSSLQPKLKRLALAGLIGLFIFAVHRLYANTGEVTG
jgi:hypothetical protein